MSMTTCAGCRHAHAALVAIMAGKRQRAWRENGSVHGCDGGDGHAWPRTWMSILSKCLRFSGFSVPTCHAFTHSGSALHGSGGRGRPPGGEV